MSAKRKEAETDNYVPYGQEWEQELMKFPKKGLIGLLRKEYQKAQQSGKSREEILERWPEEVRIKMIEKSEFYLEPNIYQYGFYDGYQYLRENLSAKQLEQQPAKEGEWQLCPKCNGNGVLPPPYAIHGTGKLTITCDVCNGHKVLQRPALSAPPSESKPSIEWVSLYKRKPDEDGVYFCRDKTLHKKFTSVCMYNLGHFDFGETNRDIEWLSEGDAGQSSNHQAVEGRQLHTDAYDWDGYNKREMERLIKSTMSDWESVNKEAAHDGSYLGHISKLEVCGAINTYQRVIINKMNKWILEEGEILTHWRKLPEPPNHQKLKNEL